MEDNIVYSNLESKDCTPCSGADVFVWQYQNYPSQADCEATGYQYCCLCIDPGWSGGNPFI